ncbi:RND transporter, partial [Pseudomonas fragi]|nr:RND transporter [Pseudomonas sp. GC01]
MKPGFLVCAVACYSALALSGCVLGPDFQAPVPQLAERWAPVASEQGHSRTVESAVDPRWWDSFGDAQLSALVQEAQQSNFDVQLAASRLEQSRAIRRQIAADSLPA